MIYKIDKVSVEDLEHMDKIKEVINMAINENVPYTKEEREAVRAKPLYPPNVCVPISPKLYKDLKDKIRQLETQNARLAQDNQILETRVAVLERMLAREEAILDALL